MSNHKNQSKNFFAGIFAGATNSILFNPYDKALYNMMKRGTHFYDRSNWKNPYHGVTQALGHRIISYGLYFPLTDLYKDNLSFIKNESYKSLTTSTLTGTTTAILLNPINVVKTHNWNQDTSIGLFKLGKQIYTNHGTLAFTRSLYYTILRDITFGTIYSQCNMKYNPNKRIAEDILFAGLATSLSSPINYIRHQILFAPLDQKAPTFTLIKNDLIKEVNEQKNNKAKYIITKKFCIGWGTLRVALGMGVSRQCYEFIKNNS